MTAHKSCYGTMFHDSLHFTPNDTMQGKVFGFGVDSSGLSRSAHHIQVDIAAWDDCIACPEFDHCYKLCRAKLALETAIAHK